MSDTEELNVWRKSTKSDSGGCVEVASAARSVLVRDSKNRGGSMLAFPPEAWSAFLERARTAGPDNPSA